MSATSPTPTTPAPQALALSTRLWEFGGEEPPPAAGFAKLAADWGAVGVEADPRIPEHRFDGLVEAVREHGLTLAAMDALCPHPAELARHEPRAGLVPLANPDESERRYAVGLTRQMILRAAGARCPVVVLHL